jgi:hypothetical protein
MKNEDTTTHYEIFRNGIPKYQLIWSNNTKRFLIDGKEVDEQTWDEEIKKDKK